MPSKTPKQAKFMKAVAGGMKPRGGGPSRAIAKEYVKADMLRGKKKATGGYGASVGGGS